jgi:hypothetical protein
MVYSGAPVTAKKPGARQIHSRCRA